VEEATEEKKTNPKPELVQGPYGINPPRSQSSLSAARHRALLHQPV